MNDQWQCHEFTEVTCQRKQSQTLLDDTLIPPFMRLTAPHKLKFAGAIAILASSGWVQRSEFQYSMPVISLEGVVRCRTVEQLE